MTATQTSTRSYAIGFNSLEREQEPIQLPLQGQLPEWLIGSLVRTGPAKFEVGEQVYRHWFDGLAMLYRFSFQGGSIFYTSRFLASQAYQEAMDTGKISRMEFGTNPDYSLIERLGSYFKERLTDNANVSISQFNNQCVALTETPFPIVFNSETLQTVGRFQYDDRVQGQMTIAHPHFDYQRNELVSYVTQLSAQCAYHIYRMPANSNQRQIIASISVQQPAYMHTFAMTENYVILVEFPLFVNPLKLAIALKPVVENFEWKPERGTRFLVVSKQDGEIVATCESAPFFAFHHVNAFEQDNEIVLDLSAYPDQSIIDRLYLSELRNTTDRVTSNGELRRYHVPLNGNSATYEVVTDAPMDLPRIHYKRCNTQPYRFVYGTSNQQPHNFNDSLVKIDVQQGSNQIWQEDGCYPGEPIFAPAPNVIAEDEGVILTIVVNARKSNSFLLVLDARSFTELARAEVPHLIPFHFHGQYFD